MKMTEQINELFAALAKAQGQMEDAEKDATNPHFRSRYANLASVRRAVRKPLSDNGLILSQFIRTGDGFIEIETILGHQSGQYMSETTPFPVQQFTPQGIGSSISYARRYTAMAILGLAASEDDDDAEATMPARQQTAKPTWTGNAVKKPITPVTMAPLPPKTNGPASLRDKARGMAREGTKAFNQWWHELTDDQCNELGAIAEELAEIGYAADQAELARA